MKQGENAGKNHHEFQASRRRSAPEASCTAPSMILVPVRLVGFTSIGSTSIKEENRAGYVIAAKALNFFSIEILKACRPLDETHDVQPPNEWPTTTSVRDWKPCSIRRCDS